MDRSEEYNFTVVNDNGEEVICDVISILHDEKTGEVFVVYTDYTINDKNQFNTYLSEMVERKGGYMLKKVASKERYDQILKDAKTLYGKALQEILEK